jgi:uncharacterized protein YkwD
MGTLLLFLFLGAAAAAAEPSCSALSPGEAQVLAETNVARQEAGLPALVVDCRLMGQSRRHARRMAADLSVYHSGDSVSENVAGGPENAREAVIAWLKSPGHRQNLLVKSHRRIGVAGYIGRDGKAYWVQQFAP